jgi:hypothetical protein
MTRNIVHYRNQGKMSVSTGGPQMHRIVLGNVKSVVNGIILKHNPGNLALYLYMTTTHEQITYRVVVSSLLLYGTQPFPIKANILRFFSLSIQPVYVVLSLYNKSCSTNNYSISFQKFCEQAASFCFKIDKFLKNQRYSF